MKEIIDMKGRLSLRLTNRAGEVVQAFEADNAIVLTGRDLVVNLFLGIAEKPNWHIAVGTGTQSVHDITDTQLQQEVLRKQVNPIQPHKHVLTVNGRQQLTVSADLDFEEANGTLTESGIFNAATNGILYNRVTFSPVNKTKDFKLTLTWQILF